MTEDGDTKKDFAERLGFRRKRQTDQTIKLRERPGIHIYVLPNLITTCNMFSGFFAIIYAIQGDFEIASYAIVAAAVFDLLDGRVARLTHSTSQFGAEYDSLSDVISFGMAPALLMYFWALKPYGRLGWLASFMFMACGALRLARFNVQAKSSESKDFQGLPIPMAGGIVASSYLAFQDLGIDGYRNLLLLCMTFLLAVVMVSTFRYRSFKDLDFKERVPFRYLVVGVVLIVIIALQPEVMLFAVFLTYAVLGAVFGFFNLGKKTIQRRAIYVMEPGAYPLKFETDLHEQVADETEEDLTNSSSKLKTSKPPQKDEI